MHCDYSHYKKKIFESTFRGLIFFLNYTTELKFKSHRSLLYMVLMSWIIKQEQPYWNEQMILANRRLWDILTKSRSIFPAVGTWADCISQLPMWLGHVNGQWIKPDLALPSPSTATLKAMCSSCYNYKIEAAWLWVTTWRRNSEESHLTKFTLCYQWETNLHCVMSWDIWRLDDQA